MKKYILLNFLFFIAFSLFAQVPANDNCATAQSLGTLASPGACGSGLLSGASTTVNTTNVNSTPENPYLTLTGCGMASPANSVWYSFVAPTNGYGVNIVVSNGGAALANPNIALWGGTCSALVGQGCSVGASGSATLNVAAGIVAGQTYYIQISGNTGQSGTFKLSVNAFQDCSDCLNASSMTVTPLPVNGSYDPGQSVTFCYHIDKWTNSNTNWLHGVQLNFGNGWDLPTLATTSPTSGCGAGNWGYYPSGITGFAQPGFYFDGNCAAGPGSTNGNPADNFGDLPSGTGAAGSVITVAANDWKFCWTINVKPGCNPGQSLAVVVNTSGDGESGSWNDIGCADDPATSFNAIIACCPPTVAGTSVTCNGGATGSATATPVGAAGPYTYSWSPSGGTSQVATGLVAGIYTVTVTDVNLCAKSATVSIAQPPAITVTPTFTNATCSSLGSINANATGGTAPLTYNWSPSGGTGASATGLNSGTYTVTVTDAKLCVKTATATITSSGTVTSTFTGAGTQCLNGNSFTFNNTGSTGAGITHAYTFSPTTGAPAASPTNTVGTYGPVSFTAPGTYTVTQTVVNGVCVNTTTAVVTINPNPLATLTSTNPTCGNNNGQVFINNTSCCAQTISSFASSLGSVSGQTVTGLGAGTPVITLTNSFGCTFTVSATLTMTPGPTAITTPTTSATCGLSNGSFSITGVTGGTAAYTYSLNGVSTPTLATGLAAGTYTLLVRDANGCTFTKNVIIINTPGPTAIAGTASPATCAGATGSYTVTGVTGGTPTYSYSLDGGVFATTSTFGGLATGTHSITVKDANGCTFPTTFNVGLIAGITSATVNASTASCGTSNGTATVSAVTGGVPTYSYSYDGGAFTASSTTTGLAAGTHTVIIKDVNTCTLAVTYNVISLGSPTTSIASFSNVTCFGLSNGSCTVAIPTGGAGAPFTYSLTAPLQTNGTGQFSGLPAGTYNISVKDVAGCIATTTVTITQPTQVVITPTSQPVKCFGTATGTINVAGSGGTPTYSYNLNGSATYQSSTVFANQSAGTYLMGIKDANGCIATQTVTVTQPTALTISVTTQNANCTASNGFGTASVSGGTGTITYSWTPTGGAAATSNSVATGNYTVTATDANGCIISSPVAIGVTLGGTASITGSTNVTCNGLCNGSLTAGMTGGTAPFTYSWSPGTQTNATAINLCPGTYSCTITDFYGCKSTAVGTITQPPVLTSIMNSNNVKCFNTPTGTVSASGTGGTGPYTYLWPTLASTLSTVPNVAIGTYSCVITDANNCSITSTISVTQPTSITLTSSVTAANCGQANGSATISISGGTPVYTQTWSAGSTSTVQGGVVANTYTVEVKDANNCLQTLAVTIPNTAGPSISVTSQINVSCFNGNNGAATTSVSGGVTPYIYSWSNGQVTSNATNLTAGLYTVSATDAAGCVTSTSVNISQPTALTVTISPTNPKCFGATNGFGIAAALGGTPSYSYAWTSGGNSATTTPLGAGNYGLTVTDGNGCVITSSMVLTNPPAMAASITSTNVTCFNACNGLAIASTTNAVGAVSYVWTGGASAITSQTLTGACATTYTMLATDQNSCTATAQVIITQPTQVTANITSTGSVTCFGGNNGFAVVTPSGGTGTHTYTWSPNGGNSATASSLTAGTYIATVADANGCTASATATIIQPSAFTTTLTTTNVKCNGACDGTGNVAFAGGVGIPTFLWQPGLQSGNSVNNLCVGIQTVTITSNGSCTTAITFTLTEPAALTAVTTATNSNCGQANGKVCVTIGGGTTPYNNLWSNGTTSLCSSNLLAGAYTSTVTDANGCVINASALVNDIAGPVVSITSSTNVSCFAGNNGAATTNVTGGVTPYSFLWSGTSYTTQNVSNFAAGLQNITVTDAAGCVGSASVTITQPAQLVSAIGSSTNVACFGQTNGGATILVNGGTPNYSYTWTPGVQTSSVMVGVGANTYTCNVIDGNGCSTSQQVTITQPQALVISASSFTNVSCFGGNNGQISTTIQGGTPVYSYTWTPAQANPGPFLSGLTAGGYSLSLTDANNCPANINFTILEPSALTSTYTSLPATCGNANGSATVSVGGGTPTYSVSWNTAPAQNGLIATNMSPGNNWLAVITDAKGCSITQTVSVANPVPVSISGFSVNPPTCFGLSNGTVTVNYSPGTAPYTVNWSNPISQTVTTSVLTQSVSGVAGGLYNVTVVDNYGCSSTMPINVVQPSPLALVPSANVTICYGQSTQISASGNGGTPGYTYSWTPNTLTGGGPITVNPTTSTSYNVFATDANGCTTSSQVITVAVTPQLTMSGLAITKCVGETAVLTPTMTSAGNGGPYNFVWSNGVTAIAATTSSVLVTATLPSPNQYTVTVDDGCTIPSGTAVFTVNVNPLPVISFTANPLSGCAPLTVTLTGTSDGANDMFTWTSDKGPLGQGNPYAGTFVDEGFYSITLVVSNPNTGCSNTLTKANYIEVFAQPVASFYADPAKTSILDPNINFINTSQGANNYYWDFGDPASINGSNNSTAVNPSHAYTYVGPYSVHLIATSIKGCKDTANIVVEITPDFAIYIPNTFTPDGNGLNDVFQPLGVGIDEENYRMDIFDRWGENIFTSNDFRKGWDGSVKGNSKLAPQGVYTYKISVRDLQGGKHPFVGHVTVIRENNN
ncbi:MAG: hypothetical protein C0448_02685 [Sphingobacteriaceae bacterium]|nr:hypothetical protein [Sphingobacteriaceae bacterium]